MFNKVVAAALAAFDKVARRPVLLGSLLLSAGAWLKGYDTWAQAAPPLLSLIVQHFTVPAHEVVDIDAVPDF